MKNLFAIWLPLLLFTQCQSPRFSNRVMSVTAIPPGKEFNLGDNKHGAFSAQVKNSGPVTVWVNQQQADGKRTALGQLKPGDYRVLQFDDQSVGVFVNASSERSAELSLALAGDLNLRMGYTNKK